MTKKFNYAATTCSAKVSNDVFVALQRARTPGVEAWLFTADVIKIGLSVIDKLGYDPDSPSRTKTPIVYSGDVQKGNK